jgi:hypothetical protein
MGTLEGWLGCHKQDLGFNEAACQAKDQSKDYTVVRFRV